MSRPVRPLLAYLLPLVIVWQFATAGENGAGHKQPVFDKHTISRPKVEVRGVLGSNKRRIGDYATVRRKIGATAG